MTWINDLVLFIVFLLLIIVFLSKKIRSDYSVSIKKSYSQGYYKS